MKNRALRVMIYCQDSLGLGHLRRNINIAHELHRLAPDTAFLFVTDSPLAPFFALPPASDFVKLPTLVKVTAGVWKVHRLPLITIGSMEKLRSQIIKEAVLNFQPDVLLVDHMPHGAKGELIESLRSLRRQSPQARIILGLRDILGAPEVIIRQWQIEGAYNAIAEYYDSVFVYGTQDIYDLTREYDFPEEARGKVRYCGYVCGRAVESPNVAANLAANVTEERPFNVLLMGGGGSDAHFFMNAMLEAVMYLGQTAPFNTFVLTGPFMPPAGRQALVKKARGLPVIVKRMDTDSTKYLMHVDLVVSMGGYNTICEVLKFAKKAVVVPRPGPSAEQGMRGQILHDLGLILALPTSELTPQSLAEAVLRRLYDPVTISPSSHMNLDGALHAAQFILDSVSLNLPRERHKVIIREQRQDKYGTTDPT